jgi:diguanylate cyclase (GGDEF)-like protein
MNILVVEDDTFTNRMLERYLLDLGFEVITATDGLRGWEIFCEREVHFVITDWVMPEMNGLELIKKIRDRNEKIYCYVILLTAKNDKNEIVEGISSGADDYIVKPFDREELAVRVRAGQRIAELHEKLFKANEELEKLSVTDPLTGLYNRRALSHYLKKSQLDPNFTNIPCSFIMVDIDHFKNVNDIHGHDAGDLVLSEIAGMIKKISHGYDMISRIGGEEFFIVLPGVDSDHAESISEQMRKEIEETPVFLPDETRVSTTCSLGVFCVQALEHLDGERCMKMADQALYESKNSGRNRVTIYTQKSI